MLRNWSMLINDDGPGSRTDTAQAWNTKGKERGDESRFGFVRTS